MIAKWQSAGQSPCADPSANPPPLCDGVRRVGRPEVTTTKQGTSVEASTCHSVKASNDICGWVGRADTEFQLLVGPLEPPSLERGLTVAVCTYERPASIRRFLESLAAQERRPEQLIVVDASPDRRTEAVVKEFVGCGVCREAFVYVRVSGPRRGLTRQRNLSLDLAQRTLIAFFDDDVVLHPSCLREMERAFYTAADIVGVGAYPENAHRSPSLRWRVRALLGLVNTLEPGRFTRTGMSIPWAFLEPSDRTRDGDWLPGYAMLWDTRIARATRFNERFAGYAQGEDLEFSLRMRSQGRLMLAGGARVLHLQAVGGRPDAYRQGYMEIRNRYQIHRTALPRHTWPDRVAFAYCWTVDSILLAMDLGVRGRWAEGLARLAGRAKAALEITRGRSAATRPRR